ncbi:MAG: DUF3300 domain-containing protein [Xanthobacteraceae bacterium]
MFWPFSVMAQTPGQKQTSAPATGEHQLSAGELDALVAPIALYPDNLLSQVLMASTFPLEVVHAERWLKANKKLTGSQLETAVAQQDWDDSITSLVATPSILEMMSTKLDWTQKLGNAVVAQQPDVMDAVQRLRAKAQANNTLQSTTEQKVSVSQSGDRQVIAIAPTDPNTVYVPYYNPAVVYGSWPYPAYPPYYWPPPGYIAGGIIATGIAFGAGYALGRWASGGYWGGNVNWSNNNITINRPGGGGGNWNRNAHVEHRGGNRGNRQLDFRGRNGQQVLNPGNRGNNLGGGNRANRPSTFPAGGNRGEGANAGNRQGGNRGEHKNAGNRQGGNRAQHRAGGGTSAANARSSHAGHRATVGGGHRAGGGGHRAAVGGGGHRGGGHHAGGGHRGGGGGGGRGGGGRRSDIRLKHDIVLVGRLSDGLGVYRFVYNGGQKAYVGVIAQEVQQVVPQAVERGSDGYLRVHYDRLGLRFESYRQWIKSGSRLPVAASSGL